MTTRPPTWPGLSSPTPRCGEGLGRRRCQALLGRGRAAGVRVFTLRVYPDNVAAVALYRSLGFVEVVKAETEASGSVLMAARLT